MHPAVDTGVWVGVERVAVPTGLQPLVAGQVALQVLGGVQRVRVEQLVILDVLVRAGVHPGVGHELPVSYWHRGCRVKVAEAGGVQQFVQFVPAAAREAVERDARLDAVVPHLVRGAVEHHRRLAVDALDVPVPVL